MTLPPFATPDDFTLAGDIAVVTDHNAALLRGRNGWVKQASQCKSHQSK